MKIDDLSVKLYDTPEQLTIDEVLYILNNTDIKYVKFDDLHNNFIDLFCMSKMHKKHCHSEIDKCARRYQPYFLKILSLMMLLQMSTMV